MNTTNELRSVRSFAIFASITLPGRPFTAIIKLFQASLNSIKSLFDSS